MANCGLPSPENRQPGAIAQAILKTSADLSGAMTAADLSQSSAEWVEPLSTQYRGWTIYELPPNGDGSSIVDYHMNIQAAMEEARFTVSNKLGARSSSSRALVPSSLSS